MPEKKKYIRFINSDYKTLFFLPDGGRIRITRSDGEQIDRVCRYIDEYHTQVGHNHFHICEFAERMEQGGSIYKPLDYIKEKEFYPRRYLLFPENAKAKAPAYFILDQTDEHCFAYAPKAPKGKRYCVLKRLPDEHGQLRIGEIVHWSGTLRDICPKDWGFNVEKIKAVVKKPNAKGKHHPKPGR